MKLWHEEIRIVNSQTIAKFLRNKLILNTFSLLDFSGLFDVIWSKKEILMSGSQSLKAFCSIHFIATSTSLHF